MALNEIQLSLYRKLGYADSPALEVTSRLLGFINDTHRRLLSMPGMNYLRQAQTTFVSVASTPEYSLPPDVARIVAIRDASNQISLRGATYGWYTASEADPTACTGTPELWVPIGLVAYSRPPADASKLYVDSTSASDVQTCYVEGTRSGGYPFSEATAMTGTTAVQIGALTDIVSITKFHLSANAAGTVTLVEDAEGGTVCSTIPIGQTHARYQRIALYPTPSSAITYTLDYMRHVEDMVYGSDEPLVPRDFYWVIEAGARALEYEKMDDRRYPSARKDFESGVRDLKWFVTQQADGQSMPRAASASQLGPWYPAGS